jgi:hypothetical protein
LRGLGAEEEGIHVTNNLVIEKCSVQGEEVPNEAAFIYGRYPIVNVYDAAALTLKKDVDLNAALSCYLRLVPPVV